MGKLIEREFKIANNEILAAKHQTEKEKQALIREIKLGLGKEMKMNPSHVRIIKKTWYQKLALFFKRIFTKF